MAPVAGGIADAQKHRLFLPPGPGKGLLPPWQPVHRVVGVLQKIGGFLMYQAVGNAPFSLFCLFLSPPVIVHFIRAPVIIFFSVQSASVFPILYPDMRNRADYKSLPRNIQIQISHGAISSISFVQNTLSSDRHFCPLSQKATHPYLTGTISSQYPSGSSIK